MTSERKKFEELDENISVKFGDGSTVQIKGKGSIFYQCKNGDHRLLQEVYYIPRLRSNIISLGQMAEDGNDIVLAGPFIKVFGRNGTLLMKVRRTANRLYKIALESCRSVCLFASLTGPAWFWHARLGYMNFYALRMMSKKKMADGLHH